MYQELYIAYWKISDVLVKIKRSIVETVDSWNIKLSEAIRKKDSDKKKEKSVQIDIDNPNAEEINTAEIPDEPINNEQEEKESSNLITKKIRSLDNTEYESLSPSSPKSHHRSQSDGTVMSQNEEINDNKKRGR
ncbi:hypothetical protein NQ314_001595 [Rhamnusium bicolor]|uniref:Ycf1 n=1 Tax=Rhamnusium bicolor TaxID=1586634 RepID=A0AAV8ZRS6_9CUCU|nr:hypothetical protein NQ314_001595 [Rhamnusium bicolor]